MKKEFIIILFFIITGIKAQKTDSTNHENSKLKGIETQIPYSIYTEPLYILDDSIISNDQFMTINPESIYELEIIKTDTTLEKFIDKYGANAKNGIIIIKTKQYVGSYWLKLISKFCQNQELSNLLINPDIDYKKFIVFINGKKLKIDFFDNLELDLKEISKVKIKKIPFDKHNYKIKIKTK